MGKFHYEKVGSTVSPGPGRFLCTQLRIAVSAHAKDDRHERRGEEEAERHANREPDAHLRDPRLNLVFRR